MVASRLLLTDPESLRKGNLMLTLSDYNGDIPLNLWKYFRKGQQVLIEGYIRNNNWTDKDGNRRYTDEIHAEQVYFADSKRDSGSANTFGGGNMPQVSQPEFQGQSPENGDGFYALSEDDEDLPF